MIWVHYIYVEKQHNDIHLKLSKRRRGGRQEVKKGIYRLGECDQSTLRECKSVCKDQNQISFTIELF
jgi:hypothetical protein